MALIRVNKSAAIALDAFTFVNSVAAPGSDTTTDNLSVTPTSDDAYFLIVVDYNLARTYSGTSSTGVTCLTPTTKGAILYHVEGKNGVAVNLPVNHENGKPAYDIYET